MRRARIFFGALCVAAGAHGEPAALPPEPEISPALSKSVERDYTLTRDSSYNEEIASVVRNMPQGGGYSSTSRANAALGAAITLDSGGRLLLQPEMAKPAYCSGATYLVFLAAVDRLQRSGRLHLSHDVLEALLMRRQTDGAGIWGRWNANGPGTACLFHDLALGRNFTSLEEARAGDFAKFWWSDEIGAREHGHSVVFMGSGKDEKGEPTVTFWSANIPEGFGTKTIPRTKIRRALFSRLEKPQALEGAPALEAKDPYLAEMLKRGSTGEEMAQKAGLPRGETGLFGPPAPKSAAPKKAAATPTATPVATPVKKSGWFGAPRS